MAPELVYCAGGSPRLMQIAIAAGFRYGARLPDTVYGSLWFADQDWKRPNRTAYMQALAKHRPVMATVMDWEREEQLPDVLDWGQEAAQYVERVVIVPKVVGGIERLPRRINGKVVVLGYSVPTAFGATGVPAWEFRGWPVHLLGGSPQRQQWIWRHLGDDVVSVDGNMAQKMAVRYCSFWVPGTGDPAKSRWWVTLQQAGEFTRQDAPYEAFRHSCVNIMAAWERAA